MRCVTQEARCVATERLYHYIATDYEKDCERGKGGKEGAYGMSETATHLSSRRPRTVALSRHLLLREGHPPDPMFPAPPLTREEDSQVWTPPPEPSPSPSRSSSAGAVLFLKVETESKHGPAVPHWRRMDQEGDTELMTTDPRLIPPLR